MFMDFIVSPIRGDSVFAAVASSWFWATLFIVILVHFLMRDAVRDERGSMIEFPFPDVAAAAEVREDDNTKDESFGDKEREAVQPSFIFRFQHQIPGNPMELTATAAREKALTTISKCLVVGERDYTRFLAQPKNMRVLMLEANLQPVSQKSRDDDWNSEFGDSSSSVGSQVGVPRDFILHSSPQSVRVMTLRREVIQSRSSFSDGTEFVHEEVLSPDTDSDSSDADGYSVKELEVDSENDWLLSEKDVANNEYAERFDLMSTDISSGYSPELNVDKQTMAQSDHLDEVDELETLSANAASFHISNGTRGWDGDDSDDDDKLEPLWEHQELIEQLKMELRKAKEIGLPTILEESDDPKAIGSLKPWKIDDKFLREDPMDELHSFYRSYRERMRKLDILNYQKMYAIGFLNIKDPLQSMNSQKQLLPRISNILPTRRRFSKDPSEKFTHELRCELEMVYVGQTCLSWEFLRWQYEKARELPESNPYRSHQYNQVACEFQQFQVLLQRYTENEKFAGPRITTYMRNRSVLRNLLQIPVIRADCWKDKMDEQRRGKSAVTSEDLEEIMEESIRIFWEFIKDDGETPLILKSVMVAQVEVQKPEDKELFDRIRTDFQKKEKKLKDLLRTGNCIVKRFKKPKEDRANQNVFFSQIDMKLVSRVLKMAKISSDQLLWCHSKLDQIKFVHGKIHREPYFSLFPC